MEESVTQTEKGPEKKLQSRSTSQEACYLSLFECRTAAGRPRSSAPGRSDEDDEVADELGEEEDKDLEVNGLQGCGERGKTPKTLAQATSLESVHLQVRVLL